MTNKRCDAYVFTADVNSAVDMEKIDIVKKSVASINKSIMQAYQWQVRRAMYNGQMIPRKPALKRVTLKPRLGKNNPAYATKYKHQWIKSIKMEDAVRLDVYIHDRRD